MTIFTATGSSPGRSTKRTWLSIDGVQVVSVERFSGGDPYAEVITEPGGMLPYAKKHLGELRFADLEVQTALDANPRLHAWIRDAWFGRPDRKRVLIEAPDATGTATRGLRLANPRLRSVTMPALDVASRERRYLTLAIAPGAVERITGKVPQMPAQEEREFRAQNFHMALDGLDCSGVLAVDPITVQVDLPGPGIQGKSTLVFPDLRLHLDADQADSFHEWFEDFVIAGNNDDDRERDGVISFLEPLGETLAELRIFHAGIFRISDEPPIGGGPPRVRVDLYCERLEFARLDTVSGRTDAGLPPVQR